MRELKFHEKKLLKKVNFVQWKSDSTLHEAQVLRRYRVTNRDDYRHYSKLVGNVTNLAATLKKLSMSGDFKEAKKFQGQKRTADEVRAARSLRKSERAAQNLDPVDVGKVADGPGRAAGQHHLLRLLRTSVSQTEVRMRGVTSPAADGWR
mgnify:CR=1 FL=1